MSSVELIDDAAVCCSRQLQVNRRGFPALKFQMMENNIQFSPTKSREVTLCVLLMAVSRVGFGELFKIGKPMTEFSETRNTVKAEHLDSLPKNNCNYECYW